MTNLEILESCQMRPNTCSTCEHYSVKCFYGTIEDDCGKCFKNRTEDDLPSWTHSNMTCEHFKVASHIGEHVDGMRRYYKVKGIIK